MNTETADRIETVTDLGTLKHRSIRGAASTFAAQGLRFVLQFGSQIALARLLTPADFGLVAMIAPMLALVQIFNELGLSQAAIQRVNITQQELSGLFWINLGVSGVLAAIMAACSPLVASFYGDPRLAPICLCLAVLLLFSGLSAQQIALMNRTMRFGTLAIIDISCIAAAVAVGVGCALMGLGYWSLIVMQAVNSLTIVALAWILSRWRPSFPRRTAGVLSMLRFGGHLTAFNLVTFACTNLDSVLIGRLDGSVELGFYDRAFKLVAAPIIQSALPISRVADSLLARLQGNDEKYRLAFLQMLEILLLVTTPLAVSVALSSDSLVPLLLGHNWIAASPIVAWLAIAAGFVPLSIGAMWLFVTQGRAGEQLRYVCLKTFFSVSALLIGLPLGAFGVARSYGICAVLVHGALMWGATRSGPVKLRTVLSACLPFLIGAASAGLTMSALRPYLMEAQPESVSRLVAEVCLSSISFAVALICQPGGRRMLHRIWSMRQSFRASMRGS